MKNQETSVSDLPPIELTDDVKNFKAHEEKTEIKFDRTDFTQAKIINNAIVLPSGGGYTGPRLSELFEAIQTHGKKAKRVL